MSDNDYTSELLAGTAFEQVNFFQSCTIAHPLLRDVDNNLRHAIHNSPNESIIFVYGPTGVGKTTLQRRVPKKIIESLSPKIETMSGRIPVVSVELASPESGNFNWTDYYIRALIALEEPLIDYKIDYGVRTVLRNQQGKFFIDRKATLRDLRTALENALKYRKPLAFIIDEAQHLAKMASGRRLQDQLDCIKSLANLSEVVHVLLGTYELLPFRNLSGQLSRRSIDIHFRRYMADNIDDMHIFRSIINNFQRHMQLAEEPDLLQYTDYLYELSIGCVGILKPWLDRALTEAIKEGSSTLLHKHLEATALSVSKCEKIAKEAIDGENQLTEKAESLNNLRVLLRMPSTTHTPVIPQSNSVNFKENSRKSGQRKHHVGHRNPKRDAVGR